MWPILLLFIDIKFGNLEGGLGPHPPNQGILNHVCLPELANDSINKIFETQTLVPSLKMVY